MVAFLILALMIVLSGVFSPVRWLAVVGTVLLLFAYLFALADGRRRKRRFPDRRWS